MSAERSDDESLGSPGRAFALADATEPPPPPAPRGHRTLAVAAGVLALCAAVLLRGPIRGALPLVLVLVASIALVRRRQVLGGSARARPARLRELRLAPDALTLHTGGPGRASRDELLLDLTGGFGATMFSSRRRDRALLAVTSGAGTLFVGTSLPRTERRNHAGFLARASVVDGDETLDAVGPDGQALDLRPQDFLALSESLLALDAGAADRILLSDGRGQPLVLDGSTLRVGDLRFDLAAPIEWRAFLFQEPFGGAVTVYQATWIRQGASAVVLVALVPSIMGHPTPPESTGIPELDRALLRDLRLTHAAAGEPPASEQRVAVDRLFVLPMRAALDRAPRAASHGSTGHSPTGQSQAGREFPV